MNSPAGRPGAELRLLQAAVFTAVCVVLSATGHALASGTQVPLWTMGVGSVLIFVIVAPLCGRERSLPGIALGLAVGQLGLHTLFACGTGVSGGAVAHGTTGGDRVLALARQFLCNGHGAQLTGSDARRIVAEAGLSPGPSRAPGGYAGALAQPAADGLPSGPADSLHQAFHTVLSAFGTSMLLGHLLAALVVGWLLRRGACALRRLIELSAGTAGQLMAETLWLRALRSALACVRMLCGGAPARPLTVARGAPAAEAAMPAAVLLHAVIRRGPPRAAQGFALAA